MKRMVAICSACAAFGVAVFSFAAPIGESAKNPAGPSLDAIKKLAGDWVEVGKDGKPTSRVISTMKVTAGGSAVLEIIFPGTDHEMVTVYYRDGKDLVLSHYCVLGNQPRMKAEFGKDQSVIVFKFAGGTNIKPDKDPHMSQGTITIVDENRIKGEWTKCEQGKPCETYAMELARKQK